MIRWSIVHIPEGPFPDRFVNEIEESGCLQIVFPVKMDSVKIVFPRSVNHKDSDEGCRIPFLDRK
jgi:hypothetical protein